MCDSPAEADDVFQETCVAIVAGIAGFRGECSFMAWVYTLVRTHRGRWVRTASRRRRQLAALAACSGLAAEHPANHADLAATVRARELATKLGAALAEIDAIDRNVAVLRDVEQCSAAEVADALGLTVSAVKSRLHRTRSRLRSQLAPLFAA